MRSYWRPMAALAPLVVLLSCAIQASDAPSSSGPTAHLELPVAAVTRLSVQSPKRILFVGNSYMYYNDSLHNHVKRMGDAAGLFVQSPAIYKSATIGGAALRDHNIDHLIQPDKLRVDQPFELVIMQGISSAALTAEGRLSFAETAKVNAEKIRRAGGEPVLYMTPAYDKPHRRYSPEMAAKTAELYLNTGNEIDALVIPVGLAFEEAYRRRPEITLHKPFDHSHPDLLGTYLAAATVMASIYGISPVGNSYDYFGEVPEDDARFLQQVAQDTVTRFYGRENR